MDPKINEEVLLDHTTFGLISLLQQKPYVCDIKFKKHEPVSKNMLSTWEESNSCILPADLKRFYQTMNGVLVQWKMKFKGEDIDIGLVEINPVEALNNTELLANKSNLSLVDFMDNEILGQRPQQVFELSSDGQHGKVCLVRKGDNNFEVWLVDLSLQWHFLAPNFRQYFRMLIFNLGIRGWQFLYTEFGLTPETKQWFSSCLPHRANSQEYDEPRTDFPDQDSAKTSHHQQQQQQQQHQQQHQQTNKVDFNSLFKQKKKVNDTTSNPNNLDHAAAKKKQQHQSTGIKSRTTVGPSGRPNKANKITPGSKYL